VNGLFIGWTAAGAHPEGAARNPHHAVGFPPNRLGEEDMAQAATALAIFARLVMWQDEQHAENDARDHDAKNDGNGFGRDIVWPWLLVLARLLWFVLFW
jgi:hypothetical protein